MAEPANGWSYQLLLGPFSHELSHDFHKRALIAAWRETGNAKYLVDMGSVIEKFDMTHKEVEEKDDEHLWKFIHSKEELDAGECDQVLASIKAKWPELCDLSMSDVKDIKHGLILAGITLRSSIVRTFLAMCLVRSHLPDDIFETHPQESVQKVFQKAYHMLRPGEMMPGDIPEIEQSDLSFICIMADWSDLVGDAFKYEATVVKAVESGRVVPGTLSEIMEDVPEDFAHSDAIQACKACYDAYLFEIRNDAMETASAISALRIKFKQDHQKKSPHEHGYFSA